MRLEGSGRQELFIEPSSINTGELGPVKEALGSAWALFGEGPGGFLGRRAKYILAWFWEISPEPVRH